MVDTIGPMVRGAVQRAWRVEAAHVGGGALGGATTGFALGALGAIAGFDDRLPDQALLSLAVLAGVSLVVDLLHDGRKFGLSRQTSPAWRHALGPSVAAFLNGFDLGLGWTTRIYFASFGVVMVAALLTAHALVGAAIGASFGAARALFVVAARRRSGGALAIDSLGGRRPRVVGLNGAALAQFGVFATLTAAAAGG